MFRLCILPMLIAIILIATFPALALGAEPNPPLEAAQQAVSDLYSYSLKIVGLAVFVMFLIAGLAYIIPALKNIVGEPVKIIQNAVIGLVLLFSAVLILGTINPDLVGNSAQPGQQSQTLTQP